MQRPNMAADDSSLAKLFVAALLVAVICNGAGFYLKRTGLLEPEAYRAYWTYHCWGSWEDPAEPREPQCDRLTTREETVRQGLPPAGTPIDGIYRYVYEVSPKERLLKLAKDAFILALLAAGVWKMWRERIHFRPLRQALPLYLFAAYSMAAMLVSVPLNGALVAAAGLRSFLFPFVALTGRWLVPQLPVFANGVAVLLLIQASLVPYELFRGIHLFHEWSSWSLASRVAGTMSQPNSMGVFAVAAFAFYYAFAANRRWLALIGLIALALVFFSGSATGMVCAALAAFVTLLQRVDASRRRLATLLGVMLLAFAMAMLPSLTGRWDVFESLAGGARWRALEAALFERPLAQVLLGSGLGVNTNLALALGDLGGLASGPSRPGVVPTDSAVIGLLIQVGVLGAMLFYAALLWAARRDPMARPFYGVLGLCSLVINVTELFPVNVLLGLAWAHSVWGAGDQAQGARHGP